MAAAAASKSAANINFRFLMLLLFPTRGTLYASAARSPPKKSVDKFRSVVYNNMRYTPERNTDMKKFFAEFKTFITRGNVVDMAVGVIVGSSFTAIVNGMSNFILKPIINWLLALILGKDALSDLYTFLKRAVTTEVVDGVTVEKIDLANSIYIDWGAFINAVINFLLVAFVLFTIVKLVNRMRENNKRLVAEMNELVYGKLTREDRAALRSRGTKLRDKAAVDAYLAEKAEAAAKAKAEAEEKARREKEENPSTEELLKQIRDLLIERNAK